MTDRALYQVTDPAEREQIYAEMARTMSGRAARRRLEVMAAASVIRDLLEHKRGARRAAARFLRSIED